MPTIRIRRTGGRYGVFRKLDVLVDDTQSASVRHGGTVDVEVSPGPHQVAVRMDWAKSAPLAVECPEGSVTSIDVGGPGLLVATFNTFLRPGKVFDLTIGDGATG